MQGRSPPRSGPPHRFEALDGLRGLCATLVALGHFQTTGSITNSKLAQHAFLCVDFFFVLSGFVIAASYRQRIEGGFSVGSYMALRLGRVYPLHLFMLLLFLVFEVGLAASGGFAGHRVAFTSPYTVDGLIQSLFLVQVFLGSTSWNIPSWSIAAEVWTYLIFALIFRFAPRFVISVSLALTFACCLLIAIIEGSTLIRPLLSVPRCIYGFGLGVIAQELAGRSSGRVTGGRTKMGTGIELAVTALVVIFFQFVGRDRISLAGPLLFTVTVLVFCAERGPISALLRTKPMQMLGLLSYSIYMIHWFVLYRFTDAIVLADRITHGRFHLVLHDGEVYRVDGGPLMSNLLAAFMVAIVIGLSWLSWRFIEKPCQRWSRVKVAEHEGRRRVANAEEVAPTF